MSRQKLLLTNMLMLKLSRNSKSVNILTRDIANTNLHVNLHIQERSVKIIWERGNAMKNYAKADTLKSVNGGKKVDAEDKTAVTCM